jgi:branched-chain amino acid transport system substrate-binding protein
MSKRTAWLMAGAVAMAAPMAASAAVPAGDYRVGFFTDSTGPLAAAGLSYTHGAELAVAEISAADTIAQGAKLSLDIKEAGGDAARAIQDMHQFLADRRILATSCCILSPIANSLKPVVAGKIALVIYGATAPGLPALPWVYSVTALPGPKDVETAATVAKALKPQTVAYFVSADNDAFKTRMAAAEKAVTETGAKTAAVISVLGTDTDFTAPATQAMGANPDVIMVYTTQTPAAGIVAALRARGFKGTIVGNDVLAPAPIWKKIGAPLVGVPFPLSFSPDINQSPEAKAFVAAYRKQYDAAPDLYAAQGYEAMWLIAQALHGMDGTPTREGLAEALSHQTAIEHNVYGGLKLNDGQAEIVATTIVSWTADGTLAPWKAPQ